jgi:hypothetical protein
MVSPLRAVLAARQSGVPFTNVHLADLEVAYRDAVLKRLPTETERVHPYVGAAEHTVDEIVPKLNK